MLGRFGNYLNFELRSKILTLEKIQINLVFCSLIRIFAVDNSKTD